MPRTHKSTDVEQDIHIWKQPETEEYEAAYTISVNKRAICHYAPIEQAMHYLQEYLEEME
jgi:hypothetical protein